MKRVVSAVWNRWKTGVGRKIGLLTTAVMGFRSRLPFSRPPSLGLVALGVGAAVLVAGCSTGVQPRLHLAQSSFFVTQKKEVNIGLAVPASTRAFSTARRVGFCNFSVFFVPSPYGENFVNSLYDRLSQIYGTVTDVTAGPGSDGPGVIFEATFTGLDYRFSCAVSMAGYVEITASLRATDRNGREIWRNGQRTFRHPWTRLPGRQFGDTAGMDISEAIAAMVDGWAQELLQIPDQALGIEPPERPVVAAAGTGQAAVDAAAVR